MFVISHSSHPKKPLSKLMGRCLSLFLRELAIVDPVFSIPSMLGVRDIFFAATSAQKSSVPPINMEMDMDNCFWNVSKDGVIKALDDPNHGVVHRVKLGRKVRGKLWKIVSIAKGDERAMDYIGKAIHPSTSRISSNL